MENLELTENKKRFIKAFIKCGLWVEFETEENINITDIEKETLQEIETICLDFINNNVNLLNKLDYSQSGHDLYLTINGHGTGFWDRGNGETGDKLTEKCEDVGEKQFYIGDDKKIYI